VTYRHSFADPTYFKDNTVFFRSHSDTAFYIYALDPDSATLAPRYAWKETFNTDYTFGNIF